MNPSDWRKAATLVSQYKQAAATAEADQLNSMQLSEISIDDSSPLVVHYGSHVPVAASTPQSSLQEDSYQEIIPGIPQGSLYPILSSLSSGPEAPATNEHSLHNRVTKGLDQYLQEAEQLRASEDNYFDSIIRSTKTPPILEVEEQVDQTSQNNLVPAKQEFIDEKESAVNILESLKIDTSYSSHWQTVSNNISHQDINLDANLPDDQLQDKEKEDPKEQDTLVYDPDVSQDEYYSTAIDVTADSMTVQMGKPGIEPFTTYDIKIPNEKVGCIFVTIHLQKYLEKCPPSSDKQAFLDIYHMLSLLDWYLYYNPRQHIYCMSPNNKYVTLLNYAIHLHIDINTFPTVWAVLSILLDTQDNKLEYLKFLQEEYKRYYKHRTREYMEKLEKKSIAIQTRTYDSVAPDFDRVSDYRDNGSTLLQGQDEQPEAVNGAENAIEHDAIDILTEYPPWSTETYDLCDSDEAIYDRNRKEIQSELFKETPVKTEDNKPYVDNIDAYNRDIAQMTQSLSDRLGLGQNNLPETQQVMVATKHTNQMKDIPDHL